MNNVKKSETRFEVNTDGFKTQMSEMPLWRLVQEIVSNGFDEKSITDIVLNINYSPSFDNQINVLIQDNGKGFRNISDVWTLYNPSYKRSNSNQSGRYNLGDKQFFAVARKGHVLSKDDEVSFVKNTRTVSKNDESVNGVEVYGEFDATLFENETVDSIVNELRKVVVRSGKTYTINGVEVQHKKPIKTFKAKLRTPKAENAKAKLVQIIQETNVSLYHKEPDTKPVIMELGVPIQELEQNLDWNIDVGQKVPMTTSRDVVSDKYLQHLYSVVLDNSLELINEENASSNWVNDAMKKCDSESAKTVFEKIYGTDQVMIESSTDFRANERALEHGVVLVKSGTFDSDVMQNLAKDSEVIRYAGKVFETTFADADEVEMTESLWRFAEIVKDVSYDVTGRKIKCEFFSLVGGCDVANYGHNTISWNVGNLGKRFFEKWSKGATEILLHELAHAVDDHSCGQYSHFTNGYIKSLEKVSAIVAMKGMDHWLKKVKVYN